MKHLWISSIILLSTFQTKAVFVFDKTCRDAYEATSSLRLTKSNEILKHARIANPNNGIITLIESYNECIPAIMDESTIGMRAFINNSSERIAKLEKLSKNTPWYAYVMSEILLQTAVVQLINNEYLKSAASANKAYRLLERNYKRYPTFIPNLKMLGVIHIVIGTVPDEYQWASKLFMVKGSLNLGMTELSNLLEQSLKNNEWEFLRNEALFYLTFCELQFRKDNINRNRLLNIYNTAYFSDQTRSNPLLTYMFATLLVKLQKNDEAIDLLINRKFFPDTHHFHYLNYMTGECKLNRLDPDAPVWFNKFLKNTKTQTYIKSTWQKLAWIALIQKDTAKYYTFISVAGLQGNKLTESDKYAHNEAIKGLIPDVILLKARLLFDGGYYTRAADLLENIDPEQQFSEHNNKIEYYYRLARIYHESGRFSESLQYYQKVINNGRNLNLYFIANSALHMGIIYEQSGQNQKAIDHYKLCLSMNPDDYKAGIHQKAKAGLNRLQ